MEFLRVNFTIVCVDSFVLNDIHRPSIAMSHTAVATVTVTGQHGAARRNRNVRDEGVGGTGGLPSVPDKLSGHVSVDPPGVYRPDMEGQLGHSLMWKVN